MPSDTIPNITLYFLQSSRAIRIAWLLEELNLPYELVTSPRVNNVAPPDFKAKIPHPLGKSPTIKDGDLVIAESGAIAEYLCETYDKSGKLLPTDASSRSFARTWEAAAEGTFLLHALTILYARWRIPQAAQSSLPEFEEALSVNVKKDLDWLEDDLKANRGEFIVGDNVTVADIMMHFSIRFMFARELGTKGGKWEAVEAWLDRCENTEAYKRAVEKTGYML